MSGPGSPAFNSREALAQLIALQPPARGRKLSFPEQCGAFCALTKKIEGRAIVRPAVVARAFDLSASTVSHLANCLVSGHYPAVRAEYESLGDEVFRETYYTEAVHNALFAANAKIGLPAPARGSHATADKYAGRVVTFEMGEGYEPSHQVVWWATADHVDLPGWRVVDCDEAGVPHPDVNNYWCGANETVGPESEPFRTSASAFDAIYQMAGKESPRPRPGRPPTGFKPGRPKGGSAARNTARILGRSLK